ncbi:MAG: ATP-binding cassette domain-containing protein [Elusimicrobiota bacterium]
MKEVNSGNVNLVKVEKIEVDIKSFNYGNKIVLENIRTSFIPGKKYGIVGDSGCGKSTLVKLFVKLYESDGVMINGKNIHQYSLESLRNKIFLLPHQPQIFPLSIKENILIGASEEEKSRYDDVKKMSFL